MSLEAILIALLPVLVREGGRLYQTAVAESWTPERLHDEIVKVTATIEAGRAGQTSAEASAKAGDAALDARIDALK